MRNPQIKFIFLISSADSGQIPAAKVTIKRYACILALVKLLSHPLRVIVPQIWLIRMCKREI